MRADTNDRSSLRWMVLGGLAIFLYFLLAIIISRGSQYPMMLSRLTVLIIIIINAEALQDAIAVCRGSSESEY